MIMVMIGNFASQDEAKKTVSSSTSSEVNIEEEELPQVLPLDTNLIVEQSELLVVPGRIVHLTMCHGMFTYMYKW